ncbi:MAG: hypothetical protein K6E83_11930 [Clostridium sp.]|nr:hypothetical protein [Clostridium sp.]
MTGYRHKRKQQNSGIPGKLRAAVSLMLAVVLAMSSVMMAFSAEGEISLINDLGGYGGEDSAAVHAARNWNEDIVSVSKGAWFDAHAGLDDEERTENREKAENKATSSELSRGEKDVHAATVSDLAHSGSDDSGNVSGYDVFTDYDEKAAASRVSDFLKKGKKEGRAASGRFLRKMLKEASIPEDGVPREDDLKKEIRALQKWNDDDYTVFCVDPAYRPVPGDLVFIAGHAGTGKEKQATESVLATPDSLPKNAVLGGILFAGPEETGNGTLAFLYSTEKDSVEIGVIGADDKRIIGFADMEELHDRYCGILEDEEEEAEEEEEALEEAEEVTVEEELLIPAAPVNTKTEYVWQDGNLTVTASMKDPDTVPDSAELTVTRLSADTDGYNYQAYLDALETESSISEENAILYDVAFLMEETDENGEKTGRTVEVQPEDGTVKISFRYHSAVLTEEIGAKNAEDIRVMHLPLVEEVRENALTTKDAVDIAASDIASEEVEASASVGTRSGRVEFETDSLSVYAICWMTEAAVTDGFDNKNFVIGYWDGTSDRFYAQTAEAGVVAGYNLDSLKYSYAWIRHNSLVYGAADGEAAPAIWHFEKLTEPDDSIDVTEAIFNNPENSEIYIISTEVGGAEQYLHIDNDGLYISENKAALRIMRNSSYPEKVRIQQLKGLDGDKLSINLMGKGEKGVFQAYNGNNDPFNYLSLFNADDAGITSTDSTHKAVKISVQDLNDGDKIVLYRSVWNEVMKKYDLLAVDGYGSLVQVTDEGGTLGWYSFENPDGEDDIPSVEWKFTVGKNTDGSESGYYWLQNTVTGAFLAPRAIYDYDGTKIADIVLPGDGITAGDPASFNYSIQLPGRRDGEFDSRIVAWSSLDGTEGLYYKKDSDNPMGVILERGVYGNADRFNFAVTTSSEALTLAETMDSEAMGIRIHLFDYESREWMRDQIGSNEINGITETERRNWFVPGLVDPLLTEDGIPKAVNNNHSPLVEMFSTGSSKYVGEGNHLFLKSSYSETGYYEYNSGKNYAYYDNGDFKVYEQLGAPYGTRTGVRQHGHFMPFSELLEDSWSETNIKDEFGKPMSPDDPRYGSKIHKIARANDSLPETNKENYNYNFGISIEADFRHPDSGKDNNGNDIIFDFVGDDDLWLFVDNVLVLDLGGIHSAIGGRVNFTTGQITYMNLEPRKANGASGAPMPPGTIRECFKKAGVFPDGKPWDDDEADAYFSGETLKSDYSGHTMKMFYLERGKNSSNLRMRFNLETVQNDSFLVAKRLGGTDKHSYSDKNFYFRAFDKDHESDLVNGAFTKAWKAKYTQGGGWEKTTEEVPELNNVTLNGNTYDHVFVLKDGEGLFFETEPGTGYYVEEILENPDQIEKVLVNNIETEVNSSVAKTATETAGQRRQVIFDNYFKEQELRITKRVRKTPEQLPDPDETFTFKLAMGPEDKGKEGLENFSVMPYYLVKTENGTDTYYYRIDTKMVPISKHADGNYYYDDGGTERVIPAKNPEDPIFDYSSQTGYIDSVPKDFTIIIKDMLPDMMFRVQETDIPNGYTLESLGDEESGGGSFDPVESGGEENTIYGVMRENGDDAKVLAENEYHEGTFRMRKVSSVSAVTWLPDAKFELYGKDPEYSGGEFHFYAKDLITTFTSNEKGFLKVDEGAGYYGADAGSVDLKLGEGIYYLKETAVPNGFLMENPLSAFEVKKDGSEKVINVLGLVEWDAEEGRIRYVPGEGMEKVEDTIVDGVVLQTGSLSNIPEAYVILGGKKTIQGRTFLPGDSVTISIDPVTSGAPMPTQAETTIEPAEGTEIDYALDAIHYRQDDLKGQDSFTYTYKVKEKSFSMAGVSEKDATEYTVTVTLRNNAENKLEAVATAETEDGTAAAADALNFTNVYTAAGIAQIQAEKVLTGRVLEENRFDFELFEKTDNGETLLQQTGNKADGSVVFTPLTYTLADAGKEYTYIIREVIPEGATDNRDGTWTLGNYTYDGHSEEVTVRLKDNGDGTLSSEVTYASGEAVFANSYEEPPKYTYDISKVIKTRGLLKPEDVSTTVYFALKGANGLLRKDGEKWIIPVEVVRGEAESSAVFRDLDSPDYEAVEVDAEGEELAVTDRYSGKMVTGTIYDGLKLVDISKTGPEVKDGVIYFVYTNTFEADPIVEITKEVKAEDGLDKSTVNETFWFALRNGDTYLMKDGKKWIESIQVVNGVPQNKAYFQWMGETLYDPVEVDEDGNPLTPGTYGDLKLKESVVTETEAKNTYTVATVTNTMAPADPEPDPPGPSPDPSPDRRDRSDTTPTTDPDTPVPDYTPDVLEEQREETEYIPDVLDSRREQYDPGVRGALRRVGETLGAARTGDTSAMLQCGLVTILAMMLLAGWIALFAGKSGRRRK